MDIITVHRANAGNLYLHVSERKPQQPHVERAQKGSNTNRTIADDA